MSTILVLLSALSLLSQPSAGLALEHIPTPAYPPVALAALISGDVLVNVEVRQDGSVASVVLANPREKNSGASLLEPAALEAARNARFTCRGCSDNVTPYSLAFAFRFARGRRQPGAEIVSVNASQSRIQIAAEMPICCNGPRSRTERTRSRGLRCLWLWNCATPPPMSKTGQPEVRRGSYRVPIYPTQAASAFVTGDVEIRATIRRDGSVEDATVVAASDSGAGEMAPLFAAASLEATRATEFTCLSCGKASTPHSLRYAFRLPDLDRRYRAYDGVAAESIVAVAKMPFLAPMLRVSPESLPADCRMTAAADDHADVVAVVSSMESSSPPRFSDRYVTQLAGGVEHAYAARYGGQTAVYGLLFDNKDDARSFAEAISGTASRSPAILKDVAVVSVQGASECAKAIATFFETGTRGR